MAWSRAAYATASVTLVALSACSLLFDTISDNPGDGDGGIDDAGPQDTPDAEVVVGDFYIAPDGDDGNDGSRDAPFLTWEHAITQLSAGQVLVALDGEYPQATHGNLDIRCGVEGSCNGSACSNGLASSPITIAAEHSRQAWLQGSEGRDLEVIHMDQCQHWRLQGLRASAGDDANADDEAILFARNSSGLVFQELLLHDTNRFADNALLVLRDSNDTLIEDLEGYRFHLNGVDIQRGQGTQIRTSYINGKDDDFQDLQGGISSSSGCEALGDNGLVFLGALDSSADNVIIEDVCEGIRVLPSNFTTGASGNVIAGSLVRGALGAAFRAASFCDTACTDDGCPGSQCAPAEFNTGTLIRNSAALSSETGITFFGAHMARVENFTSISNQTGIATLIGSTSNQSISPSAQIERSIITGNKLGLNLLNDPPMPLTVANGILFGNNTEFSGQDGALTLDNVNRSDPRLGGCVAILPTDSPLRTAAGGNGVGAHIVKRSVGGVDGDEDLWGADGSFPCGAQIDGFGSKTCANAHLRFGVDVQACSPE